MLDDRRDQQENAEAVHELEDTVVAEAKEEGDPVQEELENLKELSQQLDNQLKRSLADYQNLQRRTQEEKSEWIRMASKNFILKILPVFDTLSMASHHLEDTGLTLSVDQFLRVLQEEGVTRIKTLGEDFDPVRMEAVSTKEGDKKEAGKVVEEARAGFMFGEVVLRPAQVLVGK